MKKIYLSLLMLVSVAQVIAQANLVVEAPLNNNTQNANRAPNGTAAHTYYNAAFLVLQDELKNIPSGTSITSFGFTLNIGVTSAAAGNFTVYMENTGNTTYQKGTSFSGAISGMTQVYANALSIPISAGTTSIFVTLSTPFTYTGGGLYIAYDWLGTSFTTGAATYLGENTRLPLPGGAGAIGFSASSAPTTLTLTATRPSFLFGFANSNTNDVEVFSILAPGRVPATLNAAHTVTAVVRNLSNTSVGSFNVTLNVTGANSFNNVQSVGSLGAGALAVVQFPGFNPANTGANTLSVSVSSDQNNNNNSLTYTQSVTCNEWSNNPPLGTYTINSVGFNTGSGILSTQYINPVASTLIAIRAAISSNTPNIGQNVYGVLQSSTGNIIATTNTVAITSGMLGTYITFTFATGQALSSGTTYNLGMAQTIGSPGWFPYGTVGAYYLPFIYMYTGLGGGAYTILTANFGYFGIQGLFMPNITLSAAPVSVSCGDNATLQAVSSTNYSWSTGASTSSIVVTSPTVNTQYTVTATNTLGCSVSTVAVVNVTPFPLSVTASSATICLGDPVTITANGGFTYTWSTNSNAASITDNPNTTTLYTLVAKNSAGCSNATSVVVAVQSFSTLSVAPTTTTICKGNQVNFVAGSAVSYTWDTGSGTVNTASINASPVASGMYTVTGANALGCLMSKTVNIIVNSTSIVATPDTAICRGTTITLVATGANSYVWNSTYSFATLPVSPSVATVYVVNGIGATGCPGSASLTVTVNENPTVTAVATRTFMCKNDKNTITASGAVTYSWSNNSTGPSIVITPTNTTPQNHTVTGYNAQGCPAKAKVSITVSNCTGLTDQPNSAGYRVFPNPTSGVLTLEINDVSGTTKIEVYDALGQLIYHEDTNQSMHQVNLREHASGVYIIKITQNEKVLGTTRLIRN